MNTALRGMDRALRCMDRALHAPADAGPCPVLCPVTKQTVRMVFK